MSWTTASTGMIQEFVEPHFLWFQEEIIPHFDDLWARMDVPTFEIYSTALTKCTSDIAQSSQSTFRLLYLTGRPIAVFLYILLQLFGQLCHILFQHLLAHGWTSVQKGAMQAKAGIAWFYVFQRSLSRKEILGEVALCALLVVGYYLRKWLNRQTYVSRATKWYKQRKQKVIQVRLFVGIYF
jgi:hypothetical protein